VHPVENNWEIKSSSGGIPKRCWWHVKEKKRKDLKIKKKKTKWC
jgi:hypothetical protein